MTSIVVNRRGRVEYVPIQDVLYFLAEHKYITAVTKKRRHMVDGVLGQIYKGNEAAFVRLSRSAIAQMRCITLIVSDANERYAVMQNGDRIEISRRCVRAAKHKLAAFHQPVKKPRFSPRPKFHPNLFPS